MAKVFRIHKGASNTISNWEDSVRIGTKAIDSIEDPVGATDKKEMCWKRIDSNGLFNDEE